MTDWGTGANESLWQHAGYQCLCCKQIWPSKLALCKHAGSAYMRGTLCTRPARNLPPERCMLCPPIPQVCLQTVISFIIIYCYFFLLSHSYHIIIMYNYIIHYYLYYCSCITLFLHHYYILLHIHNYLYYYIIITYYYIFNMSLLHHYYVNITSLFQMAETDRTMSWLLLIMHVFIITLWLPIITIITYHYYILLTGQIADASSLTELRQQHWGNDIWQWYLACHINQLYPIQFSSWKWESFYQS